MIKTTNPVSVTAIKDLEVLVIHSDVVDTIIERQPSLAREIDQVVEARRKSVNMAQQAEVPVNRHF
ncbi:hypothetical protein HW132_22195 [Brasilonema sp. CT11]|nr:hypothetical protein [Brasilonema sp. CT11]